jgi:hypothetical protein
MPDSLPDFTRPAESLPMRHCKRCHRNTNEEPEKHNRYCQGFASDCAIQFRKCESPAQDLPESIKPLQ